MKIKLLSLFLFISFHCLSQDNSFTFYGKIIDSVNIVKNANVINLNSKKGTFSDDEGNFNIYVSINDTLQISSIGYVTKKIQILKLHSQKTKHIIFLKEFTTTLAEVIIKKNKLSGSLLLDIKKTPKDSIREIVRNVVSSIKKLDFNAISKTPISIDEAHLTKASVIRLPNYFEGVGTKLGGNSKPYQSLIEKNQKVTSIADKILSEFGKDFFFEKLKIPQEKYYQFISFCSYSKIYEMHKKGEIFALIEFLTSESKNYLKIISE